MPTISVNEIKRIKSLASKKFRDMYGEFTVEGEKMVAEAVSSSFAVEKIWRRDEIGEEAMSRISQLSSPSPVLAVVRKPENVSLDTGMQIREALMKTGGNYTKAAALLGISRVTLWRRLKAREERENGPAQ